MKLKKELYKLKELPIVVQIIYGLVLIIGLLLKMILKIVFSLFFFLFKKVEAFYSRRIRPLISSSNEFLYTRACNVFDCDVEQQKESAVNEEHERVIPLFNRIGAYFLKLVSLLFGKKKDVLNTNKKNTFINQKKRGQQNKGAASTFLARFQALFKVLDY